MPVYLDKRNLSVKARVTIVITVVVAAFIAATVVVLFAQGETEIPPDCEFEQEDSWIRGEWISPTYRLVTDVIGSANSWYLDPGYYTYTMSWTDTPTGISLTTWVSNTNYDFLVYSCRMDVAITGTNNSCLINVLLAGYYTFHVGRDYFYMQSTTLDSACVEWAYENVPPTYTPLPTNTPLATNTPYPTHTPYPTYYPFVSPLDYQAEQQPTATIMPTHPSPPIMRPIGQP
jgi:hypothetical protein